VSLVEGAAEIDVFPDAYRLVKNNLDKPINVSKSTYRVKKNRVSVTLWKEDNKNTWMNLTAKNPNKQNRDKKSSDPTAGIMDMMKDMYEDGDEDMKRTIAKAWSESREKQQKGGDMF
jgi:calcyclin binding protein